MKPRLLLLVSRFGHCVFDLVRRRQAGQLDADIVGVISNHEDMRSFSEWAGLSYHYLPVTAAGKSEQEARIMQLVNALRVDLVVLARYMQILSPELCARLAGRCIDVHHSFLPSFKGGQALPPGAYARREGHRGDTAHYVTTDLDGGPIIEQGHPPRQPCAHARRPRRHGAGGRVRRAGACRPLASGRPRAGGWNRTIVFD